MPEDGDAAAAGGWQVVGRLAEMPAGRRIVVHAAESWFAAVKGGQFDFFARLAARAAAEGVARLLIRAERPASARLLAQPGLHLMLGPRAPVRPGVLHVHPGYLWGFWYLDPRGVNHASSLGAEAFPGGAATEADRVFVARVAGPLLAGNVSKAVQAPRRALGEAAAVVFLQEIEHYANPVHWLDTETMLRVVAGWAGGRKVWVKLHPQQAAATAARIRAQVAGLAGVEVVEASLHDLIGGAEVVVTQNSAAGFEALLQRRAVVTCAATDYHHATLVAKNPAQLRRALAGAAAFAAGFPYERYLAWFLGRQIESAAAEFEDRVWERCLASGALGG